VGRIVRLPPEAVEKIAAGEVIDRPAAVVKELLENAFDAGASYVVVDLAGGGTEAITVADDGCGMDPEDARLAFSRHATSKIRGAEDLWRITTLGFRGEALASIGAVARVSLMTRPADSLAGTAVEVEGGRILSVGPAGCPPGTTVRVRDLFFNTPARRKYLRTSGAEAGAALETAARLALGYPRVAVSVRHNGREVLRTPGTGDRREVIAALFGGAVAAKLLPVEAADGLISIQGFAGPPEINRSNRQQQVFLVNNRCVRLPGLLGPVQEAYRGLLPAGRFPVVVLWLTVPPEEVDVNVHPAKLEVRLLREKMVAALVFQGLRRALRNQRTAVAAPAPAGEPPRPEGRQLGWGYGGAGSHVVRAGEEIAPYAGASPLHRLRVVGWLPPVYILAHGETGLFIIDAHAAHERILFEQYLEQMRRGGASQYLLPAQTVELEPRHLPVLERYGGVLRSLGLVLEPFGGRTYLVKALPHGWKAAGLTQAISDLLEYLEHEEPGPSPVDRAAAALACRGAAAAGERIEGEAASALVRRLAAAADPWVCPHGRPTVIAVGYDDLARRFRRGRHGHGE